MFCDFRMAAACEQAVPLIVPTGSMFSYRFREKWQNSRSSSSKDRFAMMYDSKQLPHVLSASHIFVFSGAMLELTVLLETLKFCSNALRVHVRYLLHTTGTPDTTRAPNDGLKVLTWLASST